MAEQTTRLTLEQLRKLKSLSNARKFQETTEEDIERQISNDPVSYTYSTAGGPAVPMPQFGRTRIQLKGRKQ